jgi:hypothetical protein
MRRISQSAAHASRSTARRSLFGGGGAVAADAVEAKLRAADE